METIDINSSEKLADANYLCWYCTTGQNIAQLFMKAAQYNVTFLVIQSTQLTICLQGKELSSSCVHLLCVCLKAVSSYIFYAISVLSNKFFYPAASKCGQNID